MYTAVNIIFLNNLYMISTMTSIIASKRGQRRRRRSFIIYDPLDLVWHESGWAAMLEYDLKSTVSRRRKGTVQIRESAAWQNSNRDVASSLGWRACRWDGRAFRSFIRQSRFSRVIQVECRSGTFRHLHDVAGRRRWRCYCIVDLQMYLRSQVEQPSVDVHVWSLDLLLRIPLADNLYRLPCNILRRDSSFASHCILVAIAQKYLDNMSDDSESSCYVQNHN